MESVCNKKKMSSVRSYKALFKVQRIQQIESDTEGEFEGGPDHTLSVEATLSPESGSGENWVPPKEKSKKKKEKSLLEVLMKSEKLGVQLESVSREEKLNKMTLQSYFKKFKMQRIQEIGPVNCAPYHDLDEFEGPDHTLSVEATVSPKSENGEN